MSIILRLSLSYYLVKAIFYSNGFDACNILRRKIKKRFPERNHEKRFNSVIMKGITCVDLQNKDKKRKRDQTLHMGATKMAPSQNCGSFLCKRSATAPPMDSPIKNLILFLYSSFSAVLIIHRTKKKKKKTTSLTNIFTKRQIGHVMGWKTCSTKQPQWQEPN